MPAEPVVVSVGACRCPGTPHTDGDTVSLAPELTVPMGLALNAAIRALDADDPDAAAMIEATMGRIYLDWAVVNWTFADEKGRTIPVTRAAIREMLPYARGGLEVAERADELYSQAFFGRLVARTSTSSRPGRTGDSTSAKKQSRSPRPMRSVPSSPATSADTRQSIE